MAPVVKYNTNDIVDFVIEKCEDIVSPLNITQLHSEYNDINGFNMSISTFFNRINALRSEIQKNNELDTNAKVKQLFGLSAEIGGEYLKEIRKEATVELDEKNRIAKYIANDGSLKLEGIHYSRSKIAPIANKNNRVKKNTAGSSSSFKRGHTNTINQGLAEKKKKNTVQIRPQMESDDSVSDNNDRVKLEPFNGRLNNDLTRGAVIDDGDNFVEEIAEPEAAPNRDQMLMDVKMEERNIIYFSNTANPAGVKEERTSMTATGAASQGETNGKDMPSEVVNKKSSSGNASSNENGDHSSLQTVLEPFHALIDNLDLPILGQLQAKIAEKMQQNEKNMQEIPNNDIHLLLKLCLSQVTRGVTSISSFEDSFSLKEVLGHLKWTVSFLKFPSLNKFQDELKGMIGELRVQDKRVPLTIIQSALQVFYDHIIAL